MEDRNLLGIHPQVDEAIRELAYFARRYEDSHYANAGDVSQVLSLEAGAAILERYAKTASPWHGIDTIEDLAHLRRDGRTGYRAQGILDPTYYVHLEPLAGRLVLVTRTGADLSSLSQTIQWGRDGQLFNVIEVDRSACRVRIVYGNAEYGSIPSIETHVHLLANAFELASDHPAPAVIHAHPYHLVALGRDRRIGGDPRMFNAAIHSSVEGLNRNYPHLVGVVPYAPSGSRQLVGTSIAAVESSPFVLWMNHGVIIRAENIRRAYTLLGYGEAAAQAALDTVREGAHLLPESEVSAFLKEHSLEQEYAALATGRRLINES